MKETALGEEKNFPKCVTFSYLQENFPLDFLSSEHQPNSHRERAEQEEFQEAAAWLRR